VRLGRRKRRRMKRMLLLRKPILFRIHVADGHGIRWIRHILVYISQYSNTLGISYYTRASLRITHRPYSGSIQALLRLY
jgi:hypothetical protein